MTSSNTGTSDESDRTPLSRRKILAMGSAGVAGGLAGCGGGDDDEPADTASPTASPTAGDGMGDGDDDTMTPGGEMVEDRLDRDYGTVPTEVQLGWGGNAGSVENYITETLGMMRVDGQYSKQVMEDWTLDDKTLTIKIKDGYTFHDGSPLDIKHAIMGHQLVYWLSPDEARWEEPPEALDRRTARFIYPEKKAPTIIIRYFSHGATGALPQRFLKKTDYYQETITMMSEAGSSEERDQILEDRVKSVGPNDNLEHVAKNDRGSGVYRIASPDDITEEYIDMVRYDDHPDVTNDFPPKFRYHFTGGEAARNQLITNDVQDFRGGAFPEKLREPAPDHLKTLAVTAIPQGTVVHFNYKNKDIAKRNVRRAIYTYLDMRNIVASSESEVLNHTYQLGMTEDLCDNFLGEEFVDNRIRYAHPGNLAGAKGYMKQAGYEFTEDGTWVDENGDETDITLVAHSNKAVVAKAIADPLNDFGLNVEALTIGNPNYNNRVRNEKDYDMALWAPYGDWGGVPHPWYFYRVDKHINLNLGGGAAGATAWRQATSLDDLEEGTDYVMKDGEAVAISNHHPIKPTIPKEHGIERIVDGGKQINLLENDNFLVRGEEVQKRARQSAQYYNFDLPNFMIWEHTTGMWGDTKGFNWPAKDNEIYKTVAPNKHVIQTGNVNVKYK